MRREAVELRSPRWSIHFVEDGTGDDVNGRDSVLRAVCVAVLLHLPSDGLRAAFDALSDLAEFYATRALTSVVSSDGEPFVAMAGEPSDRPSISFDT